jgi:hypothetical protein
LKITAGQDTEEGGRALGGLEEVFARRDTDGDVHTFNQKLGLQEKEEEARVHAVFVESKKGVLGEQEVPMQVDGGNEAVNRGKTGKEKVLVPSGGSEGKKERRQSFKRVARSGKDGQGGKEERKVEGVDKKRRADEMEIDVQKNTKKGRVNQMSETEKDTKCADAGLSEQPCVSK